MLSALAIRTRLAAFRTLPVQLGGDETLLDESIRVFMGYCPCVPAAFPGINFPAFV